MAMTVVEIVSPKYTLVPGDGTPGTSPIQSINLGSVVEVVTAGVSVLNAVVSEAGPIDPYDGQIWIDVS